MGTSSLHNMLQAYDVISTVSIAITDGCFFETVKEVQVLNGFERLAFKTIFCLRV